MERPATVLVAEDERDTREAISRALGRAGHGVFEMVSEVDGMPLCICWIWSECENRFVGTGAALARYSARVTGCTSIPVLAMTAINQPEDRAACLAAGMNGMVSKPLRASELMHALGMALAKPKAPPDKPANAVASKNNGSKT